MAEFPHSKKPISSLEDQRLKDVLEHDYASTHDPLYEETTMELARSIAKDDPERAERVYQELRRTVDAMSIINAENTDIDQASGMINAFVTLQGYKIQAIVHPEEPLSPKGQ